MFKKASTTVYFLCWLASVSNQSELHCPLPYITCPQIHFPLFFAANSAIWSSPTTALQTMSRLFLASATRNVQACSFRQKEVTARALIQAVTLRNSLRG